MTDGMAVSSVMGAAIVFHVNLYGEYVFDGDMLMGYVFECIYQLA